MGAALDSYYHDGRAEIGVGSSITEGIGQGRITKNPEGAPIDVAYPIPDEEAVSNVFDLLEHEGLCLRRLDRHQYCWRGAARQGSSGPATPL